jgi:hypothetical protein
MPQFKTGVSLGLLSGSVDVEDNSYLSSTYFLVSEFNGSFGLGKNSIIINNPTQDLKVEVVDYKNTTLYSEKAVTTDIVNKKQIVVASFHVYDQNYSGIGKLIITGTVKEKLIRYIANVYIDTKKVNSSKIRFYDTPTLEVSPLLTFASKTNTLERNPKHETGSFYSFAVYPQLNFNVDDNQYSKNEIDYRIISKDSRFSSSFASFPITVYIDKIKNSVSNVETSTNITQSYIIKNVINNTTLQLEAPIVNKNQVNNKNFVAEVVSGKYIIDYSNYIYSHSFFTTESLLTEKTGFDGKTRFKKYSVAEITYRNLNTFSGTIQKHKLYKKSLNLVNDYTTVLEENFLNNEILKNYIVPVKNYQNLGNFYSQDFINTFWFTSSNLTQLQYDTTVYSDGLKIVGSNIDSGYCMVKLNTSQSYRDATYIPFNENEYLNQSGESYDTNFIKLLKRNDYSLKFNCSLIDKSLTSTATLDFYLTGSYPDNKKELSYNSTYGVKLGSVSITEHTKYKNFNKTLEFKFNPLNDLYGTVVVVPRGFNSVVINNLSIKLDKTEGFGPNSYTVRVPFPVDQPNELFEIKAELYDNNSNLVYSNLKTTKAFDPSGSSSPVSSFDTTVITAGTVNVTTELNVTGSINVVDFNCTPATNLTQVDYLVTWDSINKNLCVITASALGSGSGGSGLVTGSTYPITSSWAIYAATASYFSGSITNSETSDTSTSASYALSASYAETASYFSGSITDAISASYALSSSYADTASYFSGSISDSISSSYALNSDTASYLTSTNNYEITELTASGNISSSGTITSLDITSSLYGTSSWAISASWAPGGSVSGGETNYIPLWSSSTTLTSSFMSQSIDTIDCSGSFNVTDYYKIQGNVVIAVNTSSFNYFYSTLPLNFTTMTGTGNTAVGDSALLSITSGEQNVAIGRSALYSNDIGSLNTVVGEQAMYQNTQGSSNCVFGGQSLFSNIDGIYNCSFGFASLQSNVNGVSNTAIGNSSLESAEGNYNIALGDSAGTGLAVGDNNIIIGAYTDVPLSSGSYQLCIGDVIFGKNLYGGESGDEIGNIGIGIQDPVNTLDVNGNISCSYITASLLGTASYAETASYYGGSVLSSSYSLSSSYALTSSYAETSSVTDRISNGTSSYLARYNVSDPSLLEGSDIFYDGGGYRVRNKYLVISESVGKGILSIVGKTKSMLSLQGTGMNESDIWEIYSGGTASPGAGVLELTTYSGSSNLSTKDALTTDPNGIIRTMRVVSNGFYFWPLWKTNSPSLDGTFNIGVQSDVGGNTETRFLIDVYSGSSVSSPQVEHLHKAIEVRYGSSSMDTTFCVSSSGLVIATGYSGSNYNAVSFHGTASYAMSSSYYGGSVLSSSYSLSSSYALSASYAVMSTNLSGGTVDSLNITSSGPIIYNNAVLMSFSSSVTPSTSEIIVQELTGSYNSAFYDYSIISGSNARAGHIIAIWSGSTINYTEYGTTDIGTTNQVTMSVILNSGYVKLIADTTTTNWNIKSAVRYI